MNTKLLILCLLISSACFGQTPPGYTKINARYDWLAGKFDSSLHIPGYATTPNYRTGAWVGAGNVGIDTVNNRLYFYSNGWKYSNASSGGGVPTLQQVLTAGSTGSVPTDIDIINSAGGGEFNELNLHSGPSAILRATANAYATYGSLEVSDGYASLTASSPISSQFSTIGVYFDSIKVKADTGLSLYTNGTQRMVIDASGNVGIGTTPDSSNLKTGSVSLGYHKVTANNYITQPGDYTLSVDNGASNWNVYLPTAAGNPGRVIVVKHYDDNSIGDVTIMATGGSVQIDDGSFQSFFVLFSWAGGGSAKYQSNGTDWELIK